MIAEPVTVEPVGAPAMPLVAVVTPVYNGAKYLAATMACVQRQTYPNIVHVVLDNASTDETPAIIAGFLNQEKPVLHRRNPQALPQRDNWNAALRLTPPEAQFVQWLCADDLLRSDAVAKLVARALADPAITCVGATDVVHDHTLPTAARAPVEDGLAFIERACRSADGHFAWQAFFIRWRKEWGEGDFFSPAASSFDCEAVLRVMAQGKVGFVADPIIYTRHHADSLGQQYGRQRNGIPHFWMLEAALRYGPQWPAAKAAAARRVAHRTLARFPLWFRFMGAKAAAQAMEARAAALGVPFRFIDYALAVCAYPFDFARTRLIRFRANRGFGRRITEQDFVRH